VGRRQPEQPEIAGLPAAARNHRPGGAGGFEPRSGGGRPSPTARSRAELLQRTIEDGLRDAPFVKIASATNSDEIHRPFEDRRAEIVYLAA